MQNVKQMLQTRPLKQPFCTASYLTKHVKLGPGGLFTMKQSLLMLRGSSIVGLWRVRKQQLLHEELLTTTGAPASTRANSMCAADCPSSGRGNE